MADGTDNIRLSEQLESLKEMLAKNTQTTERVLWIISDPDTGLVKRVGDIGQVTSDTVKDQLVLTMQVNALTKNVEQIQERQVKVIAQQELHDDAINILVKCAADTREAKKPLIAMGYELLGKLLWVVALGVIAWLGYAYLAVK
jgi:hypothetical protein